MILAVAVPSCLLRLHRFSQHLFLLALPCILMIATARAQVQLVPVITTIAGNGTNGYSGDNGPATSAELTFPFGVAVDGSGDVYIADIDNNRIRKVNTLGIITTVAGNGTQGYSGDNGPATSAELNDPIGVALDASGNLYIADYRNGRIRKVNTSGIITTVAGNGTQGYSGDNGPATNAELFNPSGVALDGSGNLYIADQANNLIRMVSPSGIITTIAGNGTNGYSGDSGPASSAELNGPSGVALDTSGNLYIADQANDRIRMVSPAGIITTVAGNGAQGYSGDNGAASSAELYYPSGVALDASGNLYIADFDNNRIREVNTFGIITTVAGNGVYSYSGDNGPATGAELYAPYSVALDASGNLYIADVNSGRVRKVSAVSPSINEIVTSFPTTVVGSSAAVQNLLIDTTAMETITSISVPLSQGGVQEFSVGAITGCSVGASNTSGTICNVPITFTPAYPGLRQLPLQVVTSAGDLSFGLEGTGIGPAVAFTPGIINYVAGGGSGVCAGQTDSLGDGCPATIGIIDGPIGTALDSAGDLYIAEEYGARVRKVSASGVITTVAGNTTSEYSAGGDSGDGGPAISAELSYPNGVAVDGAGDLYIADRGNSRIRKVDTNGIITTVAGNGTAGYSGDGGAATAADLNFPDGVAVDSGGNIYIADSSNAVIRKVASNGIITTVAGNGTAGYSGDGGPATNAELNNPWGVALDGAGNLYIADASGNSVVRKVDTNGIITTVAGNGTSGYSGDGGPATSAELSSPAGVAVDSAGNFYIADNGNDRIRKVDTNGTITTVAGNGVASYGGDGGPATNAELRYPFGPALDSAGNLYIADWENDLIREVNVSITGALGFANTQVGSESADSPQSFEISNIGNSALTILAPSTGTNPSIASGFSYDASSSCPQLSTSSSANSLAAGANCTYAVNFIPVAGGLNNGSLVLSDNSLNNSGSSQTVSLSGTGVQESQVITFAPIPSAVFYGVAPIALSATGGASGNPVIFSVLSGPGSITGGNTLTFTGTGTVVVAADQLGNAAFLEAAEVTQTVVVLPASYTAPTEPVATPSATQTATLLFSSSFTLGSIQVVTQGAAGLDFNIASGGTCTVGTSYTAGQTCTVNYMFTPTAPGPRYGAIEILDNSSNPQATLYLNGTGTGPLVNFLPGTLSTLGSGLSGPWGVAVDSSGNVFVADEENNAVKEIVAAGGYTTINTLGSGFSQPIGVAVDGSGNVFVGDYSNNAVKEIVAASGYTTVNTLGSGFQGPQGVAVDGNGNVFVADSGNSAVKEILAAGGYTTVNTLGSGFLVPAGVAVDGSGNVFVADTSNSAVKEIVAAGGYTTVNTLANNLTYPEGIAVDIDGNVFVAVSRNSNVTEVLAAGGYTTIRTLGSGFYYPASVVIDAHGNVFVGDQGNNAVKKLDYADPPSLSFPTATPLGTTDTTDGPLQVTVENDGNATLTAVAPGLSAPVDFIQVAGSGTPPDCTASFSLAASASCNLSIEFAPKSAGTLSESFVLTDNSLNAAAATQSIPLSGTGEEGIATTTTLMSSLNPSSYGRPVTIAATVTPVSGTTAPSGTVQFSVDGSPIGSAVTLSSGMAASTSSELAAGTHNITAAFMPGTGSAFTASSSVALSQVVNKAVPTVSFMGAPSNAPYEGTFTVTATTNASTTAVITAGGSCSITGATVTITAPSGTCLLTATWAADNNYLAASAAQSTAAIQATPVITWAAPAAITYGTALSGTQLDATATYNGTAVAGTFVYTPAKGSVLTAGTQTLSVTFTPNKTADYTSASGSVTLQVNQATPKITWAKPAAITYGTALSSTQLDATASVPGIFAYSPAVGTILTAGSQALSVTFTPTDTVDYSTATDSVTITVKQAAPTVAWATPAAITYGTPLSSTQLDATASVPGTFVYSPAAGAIEGGGGDKLSVTFAPTDNVDYTTATASVSLQVNPTTPTVNWANPAAITYGTALTATQLDATATYNGSAVAGTFVYTPAKGTVLTAGTQTLLVTFTPTNTSNYAAPPSVSVTLQVNQATPKITWAKPTAITYGTALSATQLDATASVAGTTFAYSPAAGTVLDGGTQTLSVTFTPTDTADYTTATDSVTITVNTATSTTTITSNSPNPSLVGQSVTVAFSVSGNGVPTGTVTVTASTGENCSGNLSGGAGSCALTFTASGSPKLTAAYSGDTNFKTSSSAKVTQTVNQ